MSRNVLSVKRKPCIGTRRTKLVEYMDNVQNVNEFIKNRREDKLKNEIHYNKKRNSRKTLGN